MYEKVSHDDKTIRVKDCETAMDPNQATKKQEQERDRQDVR